MTNQSTKRLDEIVRLLDRISRLHEELLDVIRRKIHAMKRAELNDMRALGEQELSLVVQIKEREGLRKQLMDLLAADILLPANAARTISLRQLAARVPTAQRSALEDAGNRLRRVMSRVASVNRVAGETARRIVEHVQWVFASVRPREARPASYSPRGVVVPAADTTLFDALG